MTATAPNPNAQPTPSIDPGIEAIFKNPDARPVGEAFDDLAAAYNLSIVGKPNQPTEEDKIVHIHRLFKEFSKARIVAGLVSPEEAFAEFQNNSEPERKSMVRILAKRNNIDPDTMTDEQELQLYDALGKQEYKDITGKKFKKNAGSKNKNGLVARAKSAAKHHDINVGDMAGSIKDRASLKPMRDAYKHKWAMQRAVNRSIPGSAERDDALKSLALAKEDLKSRPIKAYVGTTLTALALDTMVRGIGVYEGVGNGIANTAGRLATAAVIGGIWTKGAEKIEKLRVSKAEGDKLYQDVNDQIEAAGIAEGEDSDKYKSLVALREQFMGIRGTWTTKYAELGVLTTNAQSSVVDTISKYAKDAWNLGVTEARKPVRNLYIEDIPAGDEKDHFVKLEQDRVAYIQQLVAAGKTKKEFDADPDFVELMKQRNIHYRDLKQRYGRDEEVVERKWSTKRKVAVFAGAAVTTLAVGLLAKHGLDHFISNGDAKPPGTKKTGLGDQVTTTQGGTGKTTVTEQITTTTKPPASTTTTVAPTTTTAAPTVTTVPQGGGSQTAKFIEGIEQVKRAHPGVKGAELNSLIDKTAKLAYQKEEFIKGGGTGYQFDEKFRRFVEASGK